MPPSSFEPSHTYEDALARAADECGIYHDYWDIFHHRHEVSPEVRAGILKALGWDISNREALDVERRTRLEKALSAGLPTTAVISQSGLRLPLTLPASANGSLCFELKLEDGQQLAGSLELHQLHSVRDVHLDERHCITREFPLPPETPLGYHHLRVTLNGQSIAETTLIVCPDRAYISENLEQGGKTAGLNVALYGLRSERNWGCGDFTDLRVLTEWAYKECGFSFIGVNPLHALQNRAPYNTSPYLPLSMFYKNLIYIDVERVPEFRQSVCAQSLARSARVQNELQRLRNADSVEYEAVDRLKRRFLKVLFRAFRRDRNAERARAFRQFCEREGDLLDKFTLFCALDEHLHKQNRSCWTWQDWSKEYHSPDSEVCRTFAQQHKLSIEFYKYIQFVIEEQLAETQQHTRDIGMHIGLYHDLAVATDRCGSDLWAHGTSYVNGCRVGSPPDDFSPKGQDWAFPPPNPLAHKQDGYRLYRESIRKIVRHGGALRIDHVMRLFRLFWIPDGFSAAEGMYVADNADDLLRILALESVRTKNVIIGEDLGTVTDEMREALTKFGILSYRLFYFEKGRDGSFKPGCEYPRQALVASATHDLPTLAGFWTGRDIEARKAAGLADENGHRQQMQDRGREKQEVLNLLHKQGLLPADYPQDAAQIPELDGTLHNAVIGFLAQVPSMILLLNQEDLTKETEQQNLPGSTAQYPNWQRKMKVRIEDLGSAEFTPYARMVRYQLERSGRTSH
ncbi:MAG TPA: 4-alpha-glucanotransferase [Bryobacteraceae bacterium]|jgi:4-alpha-glucanotransferase|nr:4-alpha-glucanotransferase [Bryobacteraceae bacterium]